MKTTLLIIYILAGCAVTRGQPFSDPAWVVPDSILFQDIDKAPWPVKDIVPEFPEFAKMAAVSGRVRVFMLVDSIGMVRIWRIAKEEPRDLGFREEVENTLARVKFTPASRDHSAISAWTWMDFEFICEIKSNEKGAVTKPKRDTHTKHFTKIKHYTPPPIIYKAPMVKLDIPSRNNVRRTRDN